VSPRIAKHGVVVISRDSTGETVYGVDGKKLSLAKFSDFAVKQFIKSLDENDPYYVIFRDDVPFGEVASTRAILQSMPYRKIRYFMFSKGGVDMMEIEMKKLYPYSDDPNERDVDPATHQ
jgi:hypothetical protein